MASDLSSGCTEVNELFDDEKEEGEISLEDVSSSEEGQPYKYPPRAFGQCPYCLSNQHCATWCRGLTVNKKFYEARRLVAEDAAVQGKENRSRRHRHSRHQQKEPPDEPSSGSSKTASLYSTLQEKNVEHQQQQPQPASLLDNNDLVPISSGSELESDMELVGLPSAKAEKKPRRRAAALRKSSSSKPRKKRRKKEASLSLSPSSVDLAISLKESIHRLDVGHSKSSSRHRSPDKKKPAAVAAGKTSPRRRRSPRIRASTPLLVQVTKRRRSPPRKTSPLRPQKIVSKKLAASFAVEAAPLLTPSTRGNVTKLLKKVRKLEPFSTRSKEKGTSLKDKLSNIIKKDPEPTSIAAATATATVTATVTVTTSTTTTMTPSTPAIATPAATTTTNEEVSSKVNEIVEDVTNKENKTVEDSTGKEGKEVEDVSEKAETSVEPAISVEEDSAKEQRKEASVEEEIIKVEDDDLIVLRQIALETKHKKPFIILSPDQIKVEPVDEPPPQPPPPEDEFEPDPPPPPESQKLPNFCIDDNDEDLQLRMIALRSAVLKKHHTRMQKKKKLKSPPSPVPRIESPFTSTFIDDFPLLAEICNPSSPLGKRDIYCPEDMELDSDMELDKEIAVMSDTELQSPYSPSDDITEHLLLEIPDVPASIKPEAALPVRQDAVRANASLYSPSNPTETPNFKEFATRQVATTSKSGALDGSFLELACQESRPYSPSDATIYDPDLPGVHSSKPPLPPLQPPPPPPLQPPPMPPLSMFSPQPIMMGCPPSMLNPFMEPMPGMMPPPALNRFPAIHQLVNPLMMPNTAAGPMFAYPTAPPPTTTTMTNSVTPAPTTSQITPTSSVISPTANVSVPEPETSAVSSSSILDDFGETDLDGSPLVPMEKDDNQQHTSWPLLGQPLYIQGVPNITHSSITNVPVLMENNLVPAPVLKNNKQLMQKPLGKFDSLLRKCLQPSELVSEGAFKNADMRPVAPDHIDAKVSGALFKPIKLNPVVKKGDLTTHPAAAFNSSTEDHTETVERTLMEPPKQHQKVTEIVKNKKATTPAAMARRSVTPSATSRKRRRRRMRPGRESREATPLSERWKELGSRALKEKNLAKEGSNDRKTNVSTEDKKSTKAQEKRRRGSVEDDEETLRQLLLASMAKRSKGQPVAKSQATESLTTNAASKKTAESNALVKVTPNVQPRNAAESNKPSNIAAAKVAPSQIPKQPGSTLPAKITTTVTMTTSVTSVSHLKRPSAVLSATEQPLRKLAKKPNVIPASTKVVNNAKRYQNAVLQRKLSQQQKQNAIIAASLKSRFKVNNSIPTARRSNSPQVPKSETKRIVINLNEDTDTETESDESPNKVSPVKERPKVDVPKTDFEMSLVQFLKDVRQQQEMSVSATSSTNGALLPKDTVKTPMASPPIDFTPVPVAEVEKNSAIVSSTEKTAVTTSSTELAAVTTSSTELAATVTTTSTELAATVTTSSTELASTVTSTSTVAKTNITASSVIPKTTATSSSTSSETTVTASSTIQKTAVTTSIITSKSTVTISSTTTKPPTSAPSTASKIPITALSTTSKIPIAASSTTPKTPITTLKTPITAPKTLLAGPRNPITALKTSITAPTKTSINLTPKIVKTEIQVPGISATPQAVKHLSASQQEEYRRLKQQIYEREKLRLQKSKDTVSVTSTTTLSTSSTSEKSVDTSSSSLSSSITSSATLLASSTPKAITKSQITPSTLVSTVAKPRELLSLNKTVPKTQLVATISPMSKESVETTTPKNKAPIVVTSTKIIHSTPVAQSSSILNKTTATATIDKSNVASSPVTSLQLSGANAKAIKQQAALLDKMNNALNNQRKQITAVAQKMSTLKILTKEQINLKNSLQQQATSSEGSNAMDLNQSANAESKSTNNVEDKTNKPMDVVDKSISNDTDSSLNVSKNSENQPSSVNTSMTSADTSKNNWEDFKQSVNEEVQSLSSLPLVDQKELLSNVEEQLITKRHSVLDDITEMSGNLRQWEIERDLQNILSIEVKKLREQLRIAEEKLQQQKNKLHSLQPKVQTYHEKINTGRKECFRLSKICNELGLRVHGSKYKVPSTGAELLNNRIKEVATHTQKLKSKKQSTVSVKSKNLTKTDKTKNNSNLNLKRKEIIKKQKSSDINNITSSVLKLNNTNSDMQVNNVNDTKTDNFSIINNNVNTRSSLDNATDTVIETEPMETNTNTLMLTTKNILSNKNQKPLYNVDSTSNFKINDNTETLNNCLIVGSNSETMALNANIKTEINIENQVSPNVTSIINPNTIINRDETNLPVENISLDTDLTTNNFIQPKTENILTDINTNSDLIVNSTISSETNTQQTDCVFNNSVLEDKVISSESENPLTDSFVQNAVSSTEINIETEKENVLPVMDIDNAGAIADNVESENQNKFTDSAVENSVLIQENALSSRNDNLETMEDNIVSSSIIDESIITSTSEKLSEETSIENSVLITEKVMLQETEKESIDRKETARKTIVQEKSEKLSVADNISIEIEKSLLESNTTDTVSMEDNIITEPEESLMETGIENHDVITQNINPNDNSELEKESISTEIIATKPLNLENIKDNCKISNQKTLESNKINKKLTRNHQIKKNIFENNQSSTSEIFTNVEHSMSLETSALKVPVTEKNQSLKQLERNESSQVQHGRFKKKAVQPYESILKHLNGPRNDKTDGILCPYELMGTCNDGDCQFIHQTTSHCR